MRSFVLLVLISWFAAASPAGVEGKWKLLILGDPAKMPKTVSEMTFEFHVKGKELTGMAHMGNWPGDASIQDGKVEGERISFTTIGKGAWRSSSSRGQASGYPRLTFAGTVSGDEMRLHVVWDSVMIYGGESGRGSEYDLAGKRTDDR
jgi:hypothetical protein